MVLGKLPVPGRPTIWMIVGQGPIALAVGAGWGCLDIFTLLYPFSPLSPSLWETARYRLKYYLKGPLNPKQPTNQPPPAPTTSAVGPCPNIVQISKTPRALEVYPALLHYPTHLTFESCKINATCKTQNNLCVDSIIKMGNLNRGKR